MGIAATQSGTFAASDFKFAIVSARYNDDIVEALLDGARAAWRKHGGIDAGLRVEHVPGAFELPLAARTLALYGAVDAVVALGCVVRGDTAHFEFVGGQWGHGPHGV